MTTKITGRRALNVCKTCELVIEPSSAAVMEWSKGGSAHHAYAPFLEDLRTIPEAVYHPECFVEAHGLKTLLRLIAQNDARARRGFGEVLSRIFDLESKLGLQHAVARVPPASMVTTFGNHPMEATVGPDLDDLMVLCAQFERGVRGYAQVTLADPGVSARETMHDLIEMLSIPEIARDKLRLSNRIRSELVPMVVTATSSKDTGFYGYLWLAHLGGRRRREQEALNEGLATIDELFRELPATP